MLFKLRSQQVLGEVLLELRNAIRQHCLPSWNAPTIVAARQLVGHGHILVNQAKVDIPSYSCSVKDIISIKNKKLQEI
jgi:predicted rRNA methylase YqxC with S4 and FtsJ domains